MKFVVPSLLVFCILSSVQAQYIPKFDLQGHRGARGLKPENTTPAFITALEWGVTTVELDVVITKDNQVLVSHEPFMSPSICLDTAGTSFQGDKKYNIYKLTYEEIKKFDCGSKGNERFPEQERQVVAKPQLSDVIVAVENHIKNFSQYEVDYNIEIKSSPEGDKKSHPSVEVFSELVFQLIDQYLPWERVVIQSFDFRVLQYWHAKHPKVRLAALVENVKSIDSNLSALGFIPSIYSPYYKLLSREKVEYIHTLAPTGLEDEKQKLRVIPWTVNEIKEMEEVRAWGVDGLITDYPNRAAQIGLGLPKRK
jgi:glycerophosphoryl diester phosphodiesterase